MLNIIKAMSKQYVFSPTIAAVIGVEEATLLTYLIATYSDKVFQPAFPKIWKRKTFDSLCDKKIIVFCKCEYLINYDHLELLLTPPGSINNTITPTFNNPEFIALCNSWFKILKDKQRGKTISEIYNLFNGKTLEDALAALTLSVNNKYVSLFFNDPNNQRPNTRAGANGAIGSGGGQSNRPTGEAHDELTIRI
jgi:hypothetical protein